MSLTDDRSTTRSASADVPDSTPNTLSTRKRTGRPVPAVLRPRRIQRPETISRGTQLTITLRTGHCIRFKVAAIRYAPFCYVELEPLSGGERRAVPLRVAERLLQEQSSTPAIPLATYPRTGRRP